MNADLQNNRESRVEALAAVNKALDYLEDPALVIPAQATLRSLRAALRSAPPPAGIDVERLREAEWLLTWSAEIRRRHPEYRATSDIHADKVVAEYARLAPPPADEWRAYEREEGVLFTPTPDR